MDNLKDILLVLVLFSVMTACTEKTKPGKAAIADNGALAGDRFRVIVSSDIGGTDADDFQSMVHLFLYADVLDIEGLISSPYGKGRKEDIFEVINHYEEDYPNLKTYSEKYPTPDSLRAITKQGAIDRAGYSGFEKSTEGSDWIIQRARADDSRPLYILIWGGVEDLAQALYDAPDILPKLRVYWIGGPNKKWSPDAYQYIAENYPDLWIVENNSTYRGWFTGGNQKGKWSNAGFFKEHIAGNGSLASFFGTKYEGEVKMGDTPSVAWLIKGAQNPSKPSWGGRFVRAWDRPHYQFNRFTTKDDSMQEFGILDLALPLETDLPAHPEAHLEVTNQSLTGYFPGDGTVHFRFSPKTAEGYDFMISSNVPSLDGKTGGITAFVPPPDLAKNPSEQFPNWWTDDPAKQFAEEGHIGIKTVNKWRVDFLKSYADRFSRCKMHKE